MCSFYFFKLLNLQEGRYKSNTVLTKNIKKLHYKDDVTFLVPLYFVLVLHSFHNQSKKKSIFT